MTHFSYSGVLLFENWILREILLCKSHAPGVNEPLARGNLSICAQYLRNFEKDSSPMRRISKVANVSHSGPMSPMTAILCDRKMLDTVLSRLISFFVIRDQNQQTHLI